MATQARRETDRLTVLRDLGTALGTRSGTLWTMRNGYALCTAEGLAVISRILKDRAAPERDSLRDLLRVGLHWRVQVTGTETDNLLVSQAFCSALPVSYTNIQTHRWTSFATLVLEGAYEATLWATVVNASRHASNVVFLTELGGGAFGNEHAWIHRAIRRALQMVEEVDLDVRLVKLWSAHASTGSVGRRFHVSRSCLSQSLSVPSATSAAGTQPALSLHEPLLDELAAR